IMAEIPELLTLSISLRVLPNDGPVFFKVDGSRFGQTRTVKLLTGSKYRVEVTVRPGGVHATEMNIGGVTFPLQQSSEDQDQDQVVYSGLYDTEGVPHTRASSSAMRVYRVAGQVLQLLQREHCQFGNKFNSIEYECKPNETRTLMWINKEAFN
uniref:Cannabinoid receptor interacting protein 1a n=1 Tax=Gouania willdenowi TaxID=441366 RepID=A0A8C5DFS6_GOUWI